MLADLNTDKFVVAIGASAGGLEAFNEFFDNAGESPNLSYILIQHLSPDYKSLLVDLLSKHTKMKVLEAKNNTNIEPNCVYVIPPKKHMTVSEGKLRLTDKDPADKSPNTAIDTFFYSLAHAYEDKAIAVVLSGTGTDGSRGIEAVKEFGGLVIVQEPSGAKFDGMPRSSIATGNADLILPTKQIHSEIVNYINNIPAKSIEKTDFSEDILQRILDIVHRDTGCDFHHYKLPTVVRRLNRRLAFLKLNDPVRYLEYLEKTPSESKIYCKELLIGVTKFFRDTEAFDTLRDKVLASIIDGKQDGETVKIWVTACSTGEEAYSIAILLTELIQKKSRKLEIKMFATDLDGSHIEKASKGEYGKFISREVPPAYLEKYFIKKDHTYVISPEIRKHIVFARHDLSIDVPFIKNDLISCRNMLIYMNVQLQKKILSKFFFGLSESGFLFLGSSESLSTSDNFSEVDRKWKIFRRGEKAPDRNYNQRIQPVTKPVIKEQKKLNTSLKPGAALLENLSVVLLNDFDIAVFYIDNNYIIRETAGDYKKYLILPEEGLKFNLIKMLPDAIGIPLNTAIIKVWKYKTDVIMDKIHIDIHGRYVNLVVSIRFDCGIPGLTMVAFNSTPSAINFNEVQDLPVAPENSTDTGMEVLVLRKELQESKFNLQTAIEELETTNEELQSSNEELLSSNEELQSSNEELQSLNEELHTLNTEHQLRIQELIDLNDDLNNYFRCSDIGQIILDKQLRVRKFNPAAAKQINLVEHDHGRSITHLTTNFSYNKLEEDIHEVIKTNTVFETEIIMQDARNILIRIHPYIRKDQVVDGAVLSFVDITRFKELSSIINGTFDASKNAIIALSAVRNSKKQITDLVTLTANNFASALFNKNLADRHFSLREIDGEFSEAIRSNLEKVIETGKAFNTELGVNNKWFDITAVKMMDGVALTMNDISGRKLAEEKMKLSYSELYATKEKLKSLNQNLENIVSTRTKELSESEERFRLVSAVTNDALVDWNFMNNTIWVSDNYERLFGYNVPKEEITRAFWMSKIHPSDVARVAQSINDSINAGKHNWTQQYRYLDSSGNYRMINDRGYFVLDENGTPYRMLSSMLDITDLKKAEEELKESELRFRLALDGAEMAGWDIDLTNDTFIFSRKLPSIFGREESGGITIEQLRAQYHPEDRQRIEHVLVEALKGAPYDYEGRIIWPNGTTHWIRTVGNVIFDESDQPQRIIGITRETTNEKIVELELEEKVKDRTVALSKSNSDLEQFAYIASHDLQEPLRKIQTFISLLVQRKGDEKMTEQYLQKISASAARMSSLIKNVLQFSRLSQKEQGHTKMDLNQIVKQLLDDFELTIREKGAEIELGDLPAVVGIPHQIGQLFYNLISNALKFSEKSPLVKIRGKVLPASDLKAYTELKRNTKYAVIEVIDNGIGFDQKFEDKIFSFFYRLEGSKGYSGNGIGLALCKKIVENHEGTIGVSSLPGKGTTFTVVLPSE